MQSRLLLHSQINKGGDWNARFMFASRNDSSNGNSDFVSVKRAETKGLEQRKAVFNTFYEADKTLKELK